MDSSTYEANAISISWDAPVDDGCSTITSYTIQGTTDAATDNNWQDLATGITDTYGRAPTTSVCNSGETVYLRVIAENAIGSGVPSERIELVPAALPNPSAQIRVTYIVNGDITLDWDVPTDTGGGDQSLIDPSEVSYTLEVNEGFLTTEDGQDEFVALTNLDTD